ncbi:ty3-gypsy retrotransposon protein [Cucumis melo var. makuwa]|uniref:Ty3-gypsy retrotransposon protein n=1 Tax=Cucumis melo var. makuwa TaxID=1194695 RepID=A0A5A7V2X8_CUCMM|nr:ty3-gypsy retrotransposon protein [Cucumis melo var. makuwa]TYK28791.1 ty3-gypsy retrotransposon protein [Cucumis melo var. makuwa]
MASKKAASNFFVASEASMGPVIRSRGIIIKENPLFDDSTPASNLLEQESYLKVVSVIMADVTAKVAVAEMKRKINFLMKVVEERDQEIATLKDQMKTSEMAKSSKTLIVKANDKGKVVL